MDMPDLYYWVATVFTLGQMLKALFQQLKRLKRKSLNLSVTGANGKGVSRQ